MATTRERKTSKAERLKGWADGREQKAVADSQASHDAVAGIEPGQPILVGHHSEKGHRRDLERSWDALGRSVENTRTAERMRDKAANIERAVKQAVYSDDPDAVERLDTKIATNEAKRDAMKARNKAYRQDHRAELKAMRPYDRGQAVPHPSWEVSNLSAVINKDKKRREQLSQPDRGRVLVAKYDGECAAEDCPSPAIEAGETVRYFRRTKTVEHVECFEARQR